MPRTSGRSVSEDPASAMQAHAADAAQLLRLLANQQRLLILCHLVPGELAVGDLAERMALSQPGRSQAALSQSALSQHLALLRESGLVTTRRDGQRVFYAVAPGPANAVLETLHAIYCQDAS